MRVSKLGLIAAGAYVAIALTLYALGYAHPSGLGYEFIPLLRWALPWRFVFNSDAYAILLGVPLNTLVIYCGIWLGLRLLQKARENSKPTTENSDLLTSGGGF